MRNALRILGWVCMLILGVLMLPGCGGGHRGSFARPFSIHLTDALGNPLTNGKLPANEALATSLDGFLFDTQYEFFLFGPPSSLALTAPDGRLVTAYARLSTDGQGKIPTFILDYRLGIGRYTLEVTQVAEATSTPDFFTRNTFEVVEYTGPAVYAADAQGNPCHRFAPGDTINVAGQGFPANQQVDIYVVADQTAWKTGDMLIDLSGVAEGGSQPDNERASRHRRQARGRLNLQGSPDLVTIDATGRLPVTSAWPQIQGDALGRSFDIVADVNRNGLFDTGTDLVANVLTPGFVVLETALTQIRQVDSHLIADLIADSNGQPKTSFTPGDAVSVVFNPSTPLPIGADRWVRQYVVTHRQLDQWIAGLPLVDVSGPNGISAWKGVTVDPNTTFFGKVPIWPGGLQPGEYDVVIDVNHNGYYDPLIDILGIQPNGGSGFRVWGANPEPSPTPGPVNGPLARRKWTVMVYMTTGKDGDLDSAAVTDINEMEQADASANVNVVVQLHRFVSGADWRGTRRYYITHDTDNSVISSTMLQDMGTVNMGNRQALQDFITWAKTMCPADRYMLVLWDHGSGFRSTRAGRPGRNICWDGNDIYSLNIPSIAQALNATGKEDVLWMDACLMSNLETIYDMEFLVDCFVGSETLEPQAGGAYDRTLQWLVENPDATAQQLSARIVDDYKLSYQLSLRTQLSQVAYDLSKLDRLRTNLNELVDALTASSDGAGNPQIPPLQAHKTQIQALVPTIYAPDARNRADLRDLYHFVSKLKETVNDNTRVQSACDGVLNAMTAAQVAEYHSSDVGDAHGLSIWLPNQGDFNTWLTEYNQLKISRLTKWKSFLAALWSVMYRIKLTWGQEPRDLDSHLWDAAGNHLYYPYSGASSSPVPGATLDKDVTTGRGPELITINFLTPNEDKHYSYAIYLYSGSASTEPCVVEVFKGSDNSPYQIFFYNGWDPNGNRWWYVFDIDPLDGIITPVDKHLNTSPRAILRAMPSKSKG